MIFDFNTPITLYELIAIILAGIALIMPFIKWLFDKIFKKPKLNYIPSETVTLFFNKSGSYVSLGGVYEAKNKPIVIKNISVRIIRESDKAELPLDWSSFTSPIYRRIAGNYENTFETAHPFKVDAYILFPVFTEFSSITENIEEEISKILEPVYQYTSDIIQQNPNIGFKEVDELTKSYTVSNEARNSLNDLFFWEPDKYIIELKTQFNSKQLLTKHQFSLSKEESNKLRDNITSLLIGRVADSFQLRIFMNNIRKKYTTVNTIE